MSSGGVFLVVMLGVIVFGLFCGWLYVAYQVEHGEKLREAEALAEFGPMFDLEPSAKHVTQDRSAHRLRYVTDWDEVRKKAGR
jgi:hypothetical protein